MATQRRGCFKGCNRATAQIDHEGNPVHKALVIAASISNAQMRTMRFEATSLFTNNPEYTCDLIVNLGAKGLFSFLNESERPPLGVDTWRGNSDTATAKAQLTHHRYAFTALVLDQKTDQQVQRQFGEKVFGVPTYVIGLGSIALREFDPDGSIVLRTIYRM